MFPTKFKVKALLSLDLKTHTPSQLPLIKQECNLRTSPSVS